MAEVVQMVGKVLGVGVVGLREKEDRGVNLFLARGLLFEGQTGNSD